MTTAATTSADILALAGSLVAAGGSAEIRTGCDRAYYAAFHFCSDHLSGRGLFTPSARSDDHRALVVALRPHNFRAGNDLHRLRISRNRYTYRLGTLRHGRNSVISPAVMLTKAQAVIAAAAAI